MEDKCVDKCVDDLVFYQRDRSSNGTFHVLLPAFTHPQLFKSKKGKRGKKFKSKPSNIEYNEISHSMPTNYTIKLTRHRFSIQSLYPHYRYIGIWNMEPNHHAHLNRTYSNGRCVVFYEWEKVKRTKTTAWENL